MLKNRLAVYLKLLIPVLILGISSLACSFGGNDSNSGLEATAEALSQTATALAIQSTQTSLQATQAAIQPTATRQPVQQATTESSLPKPPQPPAQSTNPTSAPASSSQISTGNFYIVNDSSQIICYVYLSLSSSSEWGYDQLGDSAVVNPGETFTIYDVPYDTYDLLVEDCAENTLYEEYYLDFPNVDTFTLWDDNTTEPLCGNGVCDVYENGGNCPQDCGSSSSGSQVPLTIVNHTSEPICYVWYGPPYSEWIGDALGDQTIPGWGSLTVYIYPGDYALSANDCSGDAGLSEMEYVESMSIYSATTWDVDP